MESNWYNDNVLVDPRLVGTDALSTVIKSVSTPRITMQSKAVSQTSIFHGMEPPRMFTGYECQFGKYTFEKSPIPDEDVIILRVVKKYNTDPVQVYSVKHSPITTVFYRTVQTRRIGHFDLYEYRALSPGFGYNVHQINTDLLKEGTRVPKGTIFNRSIADRTPAYANGINVNIAYMGLTDVTEDPVGISETLARKLTRTSIHTSNINLKEERIGVRLFSDEYQYKIFPDIGEVVTPEGILMATRTYNVHGLFEYTERNLKQLKVGDYKYKVQPGSVVRDIDVWIAPRKLKDKERIFKDPMSPLHQMYKYHYHKIKYSFEFLRIYAEYQSKYEFTDYTNNCMLDALTYCTLHHPKEVADIGPCFGMLRNVKANGASATIYDKKNSLDFAYIRIVTSVDVMAHTGTKLTNRYGNKGIVSNIWPSGEVRDALEITHIIPDDHRPVDQDGIVCDMIMSPDSPLNRLNPEQLAELAYLRLADLIVKDTMEWSIPDTYEHIMGFLDEFNRNYGKLMRSKFAGREAEYVDLCRTKGIYLHNHLAMEERTPENDLAMFTKYNYRESPVTFKRETSPGVVETITSVNPVAIGPQYIYLLNKDPIPSATELGYINNHNLPVKNTNAKTTMGSTPIRMGEQETTILSQALSIDVINRLNNLSGQSPEETKGMFLEILRTSSPSTYDRYSKPDDAIMDNNVILNMLRHMFASAGIDITPESYYGEDSEGDV